MFAVNRHKHAVVKVWGGFFLVTSVNSRIASLLEAALRSY